MEKDGDGEEESQSPRSLMPFLFEPLNLYEQTHQPHIHTPSCPYFRLKIKFIYLAHRKGSEGVRVGGGGETGLRGREDVPKVKST